MTTGLRVSVYRNAEFGSCSNGGLSSRHNKLTAIGPEVAGCPFEPSDDAPAIKFNRRERIGDIIAAPENAEIYSTGNGHVVLNGYMFGGSFVYTSDSRFPSNAPIKLFDRYE